MDKCFVLGFLYSDNSGFKIIRVYSCTDNFKAKEDLDMLKEYGDMSKDYFLLTVPYYRSIPVGPLKRDFHDNKEPLKITCKGDTNDFIDEEHFLKDLDNISK